MAQAVRTRKQAVTVDFSSNNKVAEKLSRGMVYRELMIRLQGQITATAGNNTEALTGRGDEWAVIKRLDIIANGTDVLRSIDGNALWWLNYHLFGTPPLITGDIGGGAANPAFDSMLIIPFWSPRSIKPLDTALDSRELSSLEVSITWGTFTDINSAATAFTVNPTLEVYSHESFNVTGPFSQVRMFPIELDIVASNSRLQVQLPVGNMYRGFLMNFTDADVDQGDILNNFKIISGTTVFADVQAGTGVLAQWYRLRNGLVQSVTGLLREPLRRGTPNSLDGWYMYDHVTDGFLTEAIDTLGFSEFFLELDVTVGAGATKAFIFPIEIIPIRGGPNNG